MIQNAPPNNVGRPKKPISPDEVIGKYSREALIEAALIRQENRDLPFEERKRRAELRQAQSRLAQEAKPEPVPDVMPTLEELMAQVAARKISDSIKEAELVNTAFDAVMAALKPQAKPEPEPEPEPEHHFADLMLADETLDDAKARLSQRLRELRHYLIAPEIKVNEDGSVGLTGEEQSELQDLERRQTLGRWLDA